MAIKLPTANLKPPFNITRASHVVMTSRDLPRARDYYTEVIGLLVSDEDRNTLWLRGVEERCHHSLTIKRTNGRPEVERMGLRMWSDEDLEKAKAHFDRTGVKASFVEVPYQGRTLHVRDACGVPLEFCATMDTLPRMHTKIHTHKGAGARRMDHYQVLVPDLMKGARFYMDLGFRISDYIAIENADIVIATFLYRKDNPWDMVLVERDGPRMHHFGYVIEGMYDLIRALDIAGNLGFAGNIEDGPARHGHGHSYYCYIRDPDGHRLELLLPAIQLIDIDEEPMRCDIVPGANGNLWGLPPPNSWMNEASFFADTPVTRLPAGGEPFTAERYLAAKMPGANAVEDRSAARVA